MTTCTNLTFDIGAELVYWNSRATKCINNALTISYCPLIMFTEVISLRMVKYRVEKTKWRAVLINCVNEGAETWCMHWQIQ